MISDPDLKDFSVCMLGLIICVGVFCLFAWYDVQLKREHEYRMAQIKCEQSKTDNKEAGE